MSQEDQGASSKESGLLILGVLVAALTVFGITLFLLSVASLPGRHDKIISPDLGAVGALVGIVGALLIVSVVKEYINTPLPRIDVEAETTVEKPKVRERKCEYCSEAIPVPNARFCWSCGASLPAGSEDEALIRAIKEEATQPAEGGSRKRSRKCMICNLTLKPTDLTVWCPHCGNAFHRNHMLEWIHVKNSCPTCGKHLDEPDLTHGPLKSSRKRNR